MKTAVEAHQEIERLAKANAKQEVRRYETIEIGQVVRQGDIYIHRVTHIHAHGKKMESRQLALGNTMGSRHVAEEPSTVFEGTTLPPLKEMNLRTFLGPLIKSKRRFIVSHPEHAHVSLPPGTYQVTHQTDARTMARVQD